MKTIYLRIIAIIIVSVTSCKQEINGLEQAPKTSILKKTKKEKLDYFLKVADSIREKSNIAGVGLAIVYDNQIIYTGGLGYSDIANKKKVNKNTLFSIGSNTKPFTGALTAKLVSDGIMNWNTPIKEYIPEFKLKEPYVAKNVTIIDALAHRTGMGRRDDLWKLNDIPGNNILSTIRHIDFVSSFRSSFDYNNFMYAVVGIAQERATGKSWETLIEERIFDHLDMKNSYTRHSEFVNAPNRAIGYQGDGVTPEIVVDVTGVGPSGSISSTPKDIANWIVMLINNGNYKNKKYLTDSEYNYMLRPTTNLSLRNEDELWYYYTGFGGFSKNGKRSVGAEGAIEGQNSRCTLLLDEGFGIFVMTNQISDYKALMTTYAENIFMKDNYTRDTDWENRLISNSDFEKFKRLLLTESIENAKKYYASIPLKSFESQMNKLGYELLESNESEKALFVFNLNTKNHTESSNAFDSLGEAYLLTGNKELAILNYQKSLELDPKNGNARLVLNKLKE